MGNCSRWLATGFGLLACDGQGKEADPAAVEASLADAAVLQPVEAGAPDSQRDAAHEAPADAGSGGNGLPTPRRDAGSSAADASDQPSGDSGAGSPTPTVSLDCGASGITLEAAGNPKNRVNYVILGDGYTEAELSTTYVKHLQEMLRPRFSPAFEPYLRYRKFVNICALKVASPKSGIGTARGDSAFGGYGNDETRLGYIEDAKVRAAITKLLPKEIEVDWTSVVLNGNRWWNAGGRMMVWSGGHKDAALAAQHEGGHTFQILADEYGGNCTFSGDEARMRINVTKDQTNTAGKWSKWLDFDQSPGTGVQDTFEGGEYCDKGAFRPSEESVMNMLWDSSYYNSISLENAVRLIYGMVKPIDSSTPTTTTAPSVLSLSVVDPAVIKIDWYVDEALKAKAGGATLDVPALNLPSGSHTIRALAYDDTPWVRGDRKALEQSVSWTIQVP